MTAKIRITGTTGLTFEATYRAGILHALKVVRGKLTTKVYHDLYNFIPLKYADVETFQRTWPALKYTDATNCTASLYKYYVEAWFIFYAAINSIAPKFSAIDGKALRGIQAHLEQVSTDDATALGSWKAILSAWHTLPDFYRKKTDLAYINAKLNEIITTLKNEQLTNQKSRTDADDLRRGN